jgi:diguanylate cyclase (GGDEF)-like protein
MVSILLVVILLLLSIIVFLLTYNRFDRHIKSFIELNSNITVITTETEIIAINRVGLDFFNVDSFQTLRKRTKYLSKLFTEVISEDTKHVQGINWVTKIHKKQNIKVQMQIGSLTQTFNMQVSQIKHNRYMVTFHNISRVIAEKNAITQIAEKDELTQIYNRAKFNIMLSAALRNARVYNESFTIILFDIDHFKKVNDTFGHDTGDKILIQIASLVKNLLRTGDTFARWGGEEFIILSESTLENEAYMLAERLRKSIETFPFETIRTLTCSFGVCQYQEDTGSEEVIKRADKALYKAKAGGRNKVCISGLPS